MSWFEELTGFQETCPDEVREKIHVEGETLTSHVNGRVMTCGRLETPSLAELRERVEACPSGTGALSIREVIGDAQALHVDEANAGSMLQAASQFNLLEMVGPSVTPEQGVGIYEYDLTQGPACAIAAGAGTIYRNYFAPVHEQIGQSESSQIDCLDDMGRALGNTDNHLWRMRNGYAMVSESGLAEISNRLRASTEDELDELRKLLRIGLQWNTQVTLEGSSHLVSQAYCSALPVSYWGHSSDLGEDFARLILEASYEATICAGILNSLSTGNDRVFLTSVGGGAFGNEHHWITDSIRRALHRYEDWGIDVSIVSRGSSNQYVRQLVEQFL